MIMQGLRRFQLSNAALAPLWIVALATDAKSFARNLIIGNRFLNRWGLHQRRVVLAAKIAAGRRKHLGTALSPQDLEDFRRDGYVVKPDLLPARDFDCLREEVFGFTWNTLELRQGP